MISKPLLSFGVGLFTFALSASQPSYAYDPECLQMCSDISADCIAGGSLPFLCAQQARICVQKYC